MKQKGALLAKGRLMGIQFLELFKDDLYFELARHANKMAELLRSNIREMGYKFMIDSPSNQIFPILPNKVIEQLMEKYSFYIWSKIDNDNSSVRLVTSWATKEDAVLAFIADLRSLTI
jgi:threonine aldolase